MKKYKIIFSWLLVILWIIMIFYLSHQPVEKSNSLSKNITKVIIETIEKIAPDKEFNLSRINHIVRKNAHFFAYLLLGVLLLQGLKIIGIEGKKAVLLGIILSIIFAVSDEVHQLYVPGRGGQIKDVIIDSAGAIVGIIMYKGLYRLKK